MPPQNQAPDGATSADSHTRPTSQPGFSRWFPVCGWPQSRRCCLCSNDIPVADMYPTWQQSPATDHVICAACLSLPDGVIASGLLTGPVCCEVR